MSIGDRVKGTRERLGMSQSELARRAGISRNALYEIERNITEPRVDTVARLARALGVEAPDLMVPEEQVKAWREQDKAENQILREKLLAMTDAELGRFIEETRPLLRRMNRVVAQTVGGEEPAQEGSKESVSR